MSDNKLLFSGARIIEKALEVDPNYTEAIVNIGNLFMKIKNYDEAMSYYERGLLRVIQQMNG